MDKKMMFLAPGMILGAVVMAAAEPQVQAMSDQVERRFNIGRQQLHFETGEQMREANELVQQGVVSGNDKKYDEAIQKYIAIIRKLENISGKAFRDRIEVCKKRIAECYALKTDAVMRRADTRAGSNDFEDAIKICREALKNYCPEEKKAELTKKIEFYTIRRDAALRREASSAEKLLPGLSVQEYDIQLKIEQGRELAQNGKLVEAKRKFEEVLLIDPFNQDATQNLTGINTRIRKGGELRANATARRMTGKVAWDSAIPIVPDAAVGEPVNLLEVPVKKVSDNLLERKLDTIIIPNFTISEDNEDGFADIMRRLKQDCKRYDKKDNRGVNFVVRPLPADKKEQPVKKSFSRRNASVLSILNDLQNNKILEFKVDANAVLVAPAGVVLEDMEVRYFPYTISKGVKEKHIQSLLESEGVTFGEGSSVKLVRARNHVIIRNTPENLKKVGNILERNRKADPMIQVMFKFIEVSQNDLDELGFNWAYSRYGEHGLTGSFNSNTLLRHYDPSDADDRFAGTPASGVRYDRTEPVRETWAPLRDDKGEIVYTDENKTQPVMVPTVNKPTEDPNATMQAAWYDRRNFLSFSVYALDWADASDVLYSPRITTISGTTAKIDMSELHYYPDEWETIDSESNDDFRIEVPTPQPDLSDDEKLGVWFEITPEANGNLIQVPIDIPIKQFSGWLVVDTRSGEDGEDGEYIRKPIFTERSIKTNVTVKDGETVLIGGVTQDLSKSIDDKIPILGDIPFIGRFFQSKYVSSQKNHLLVFMTCRLVKPDGSPINPAVKGTVGDVPANNAHGLPEFSRNL